MTPSVEHSKNILLTIVLKTTSFVISSHAHTRARCMLCVLVSNSEQMVMDTVSLPDTLPYKHTHMFINFFTLIHYEQTLQNHKMEGSNITKVFK